MVCAYVIEVVFSVCIVRRRVVGARVCKVLVFRHTYVVCLRLVCILWQFSMLHFASRLLMLVEEARGDHYGRGILQSRSYDDLGGSHECFIMFTPSCGH